MNTLLENLTWTCHICGDSRPDAAIDVHKRDISHEHNLPEGTVQENVRFCNDKPACVAASTTHRLTNKGAADEQELHGRLAGQATDGVY